MTDIRTFTNTIATEEELDTMIDLYLANDDTFEEFCEEHEIGLSMTNEEGYSLLQLWVWDYIED